MLSACRQHLREVVGLRQLEGDLDPLDRGVDLAGEEEEPPELRRENGERLVRLVAGEHGERALHALDGVGAAAAAPDELSDACRDARGRMKLALLLEEGERPLEERRRIVSPAPVGCHHARLLEQLCLRGSLVGELGRALEVALGLRARPQRSCPIARSCEGCPSPDAHVGRVRVVRRRAVGVEEVRGHDLGDLVFVGDGGEVGRGRQVPGLALPARHRVVGHLLDEVLEEAVLDLARARAGQS